MGNLDYSNISFCIKIYAIKSMLTTVGVEVLNFALIYSSIVLHTRIAILYNRWTQYLQQIPLIFAIK